MSQKQRRDFGTPAKALPYHQSSLDLALAFVTLAFILLLSLFPIRSNDIWWHMAVGREIAHTHRFITEDPFTFTVPGNPWVPHAYLSGLVFYFVRSIGSATGLIVLRALLVLASFLLLFRLLSREEIPFVLAAPLVVLSALVVHSRFILRPHLFEYLFIVILIGFLLDRRERSGIRYYGPPVLLQILWVNLHASFYLGPAIILLYYLGEALSALLARNGPVPGHSPQRWKRASILFVLVLLASAVNPNPVAFIGQPLGAEQRTLMTQYTLEWRSPFDPALRHGAFHPYYEIFLALGAVGLLLSLIRLRFASVLLIATFGYLSLQAHRFRAEFVFVALPLLLVELRDAPTALRLSRLFSRLRRGGVLVRSGLALAALLILIYAGREGVILNGAVSARYPEKAFAFIESQGIAKRPFHSIGFGSYLLWRLYPERKSFIDGRNFDPGLYQDFIACQANISGFEHVVKKYDLDAFVLPAPENSDAGMMNLHEALTRSEGWALVHIDAVAYIYVKTESVADHWLSQHAYRIYHPRTFRGGRFQADELLQVRREIERAVRGEPGVAQLWGDLSVVCERQGEGERALETLRRAREIEPENSLWWYRTGMLAMHLGRVDEAIEAFQTLVRLSPDVAAAAYSLGAAYATKGETDKAVAWLEKSIEQDDRFAPSYAMLAQIYANGGERQAALRAAERALSIDPGNAIAREVLRRLGSSQ